MTFDIDDPVNRPELLNEYLEEARSMDEHTVSGKIKAVSAKEGKPKGFLLDDGNWYSAFPNVLEGVGKYLKSGDDVTLTFTQKDNWRTIRKIEAKPSDAQIGELKKIIEPLQRNNNYPLSEGQSRDQSIIRQSSLKASVELHAALIADGKGRELVDEEDRQILSDSVTALAEKFVAWVNK